MLALFERRLKKSMVRNSVPHSDRLVDVSLLKLMIENAMPYGTRDTVVQFVQIVDICCTRVKLAKTKAV